jgi:glycerate-2-kinase
MSSGLPMATITNKDALIENGQTDLDRKARRIALGSIEYAINAVDPKKIVAAKVTLKGDVLQVEGYSFDLSKYSSIYVIGGGKASGSMAQALEEVLGDRITLGAVNVPYGSLSKTSCITLNQARHPIPDKAGVEGTRQILQVAQNAGADDLVICLVSGGGSSLMPYPRGDVTIEDKQMLTSALLKSGAAINEVNAVRKHLSGFKGGWLAKKAYPATVLNLLLSDVVGDPLDVIASGPNVADSTTFADAKGVLQRYGLWADAPESVRQVIIEGEKGLIEETPKAGDVAFTKVYNFVLGSNRTASLAAGSYLKSIGLNTALLTSMLEGEAKTVGGLLSSVANEIIASGNPLPAPVAVIVGGETTVKVTGKGLGGRNQEIALSAAIRLAGARPGVVVASIGTDGVDGPTDAAGAIVDASTSKRAGDFGLNPQQFLSDNDSYRFFQRLGDLVFTGQTGTNVNDISLIIVL